MGARTNLRLKLIDFWKKNRTKILIILLVWLVIIAINYILNNLPEEPQAPKITYTPHTSVIQDKEVPEKLVEPIVNLIDKYFNYCNNGEYENAYNLITEECRKNLYPTLEQFTGYINYVFDGKKKIYNIQSYSIVENKYIYTVRILDDILANGTTDGYYYYEEKFVLTEENGEMKLSIGNYVGEEKIDISVEDDNLEIKVLSKDIDYDKETYTVRFRNKTDKTIVILDNDQNNEVLLDIGDQTRKVINHNNSIILLNPNTTSTEKFVFNKYYDNGRTSQKLIFGAIRILESYDVSVGTTQEVLDNAIKLYGLEVDVTQ